MLFEACVRMPRQAWQSLEQLLLQLYAYTAASTRRHTLTVSLVLENTGLKTLDDGQQEVIAYQLCTG